MGQPTKRSLTLINQSWPHWKDIANGIPCSKRQQKPTENQQEKKRTLKQQDKMKIEKDVNQWHNVYPRLKIKIKGPNQ
jgi:DNA/RNA-binding domain of Phe-tRNA-synthetase-like protein